MCPTEKDVEQCEAHSRLNNYYWMNGLAKWQTLLFHREAFFLWSIQEYISMLLLLLLSRFSRVWLCATPETAAHQAPLSVGFSRQEHWSGLPFPSPMHESEKWKWSLSRVQLLATPWTAAHQAPPSKGFSRQEYRSGVPSPSPFLLLLPLLIPSREAL